MRAFVQCGSDGLPHSYNFFIAYKGFEEMGFEMIRFNTYDELKQSRPEDIVVGYVGTVRKRLGDFGITAPEMDYPAELEKYLGRKIWTSKIDTINSNPELWPVFLKPVEDKKFTGVVVRSPKDLIGCGSYDDNADVLCSEVLDFAAEWRCFVRYGRILDIRRYEGDWRLHFDPQVVENAVSDYVSAPAGYAIDFGLTRDGRTLLLEVNDGYALGHYGLFYIDYAKLLSARWAELTHTEDECNF